MDGIVLTRHQSRMIDSVAIDRYGIPGMVLMENAGRGTAELLLEWDPSLATEGAGTVCILCGGGNNAGDGFVIARHLEIAGVRTGVVLLRDPADLRGDALLNYQILRHTGVDIVDFYGPAGDADLYFQCADAVWLVDALLGTGAKGEPREPYRTAIEWMNRQAARLLAIDVPSGLDCDTGTASEVCVRADHTCTFVALKQGFTEPTAQEYLGQVHVVSIGIPPRLIREVVGGEIGS